MREELIDRKRKRDSKPEYLQYKKYIYVVILLIVALISFFPMEKAIMIFCSLQTN